MKSLEEIVKGISYFAGLPEHEIARLASSTRRVSLDSGETLFHEGEPADGMYYVCRGRVKIVRFSPEGRQLIVREFRTGETFNEVGALDSSENAATAIAEERDTLIVLVPGEVIRDLAHRYPGLSAEMVREMAEKLRFAMGKMNSLALLDVKSRLAAYLVEAAGETGVLEGVSHEELAAHLGTVRQVLSRALGELQRTGAVEVRRGSIRIVDVNRLLEHD